MTKPMLTLLIFVNWPMMGFQLFSGYSHMFLNVLYTFSDVIKSSHGAFMCLQMIKLVKLVMVGSNRLFLQTLIVWLWKMENDQVQTNIRYKQERKKALFFLSTWARLPARGQVGCYCRLLTAIRLTKIRSQPSSLFFLLASLSFLFLHLWLELE